MTTNKNLVEANKELNQANTLQKKARRKYCLFALLLIVLVSAVIGIVFLTKS
jgi:t-SNARE complex subunit (syntaxin)